MRFKEGAYVQAVWLENHWIVFDVSPATKPFVDNRNN